MDKDKNKIHIMFLYLEQSKMVVIAKGNLLFQAMKRKNYQWL
jgi:uncharacterized membrane protein YcaP (DUF421 family)